MITKQQSKNDIRFFRSQPVNLAPFICWRHHKQRETESQNITDLQLLCRTATAALLLIDELTWPGLIRLIVASQFQELALEQIPLAWPLTCLH